MRLSRSAATLLLLFALSGVSGLIYQSVWSHYLGLTLGHAAYAQTLVLAIFMGAMALGAWLASRRSSAWANPIRAYAVIEAVIGVFGLGFHALFVAHLDVSQNALLPSMSQGTAHLYQWVSSALLILPQCVLLGMTFPLLSAGFIRADRRHDAEALGGLYFTNSLGAGVGALLATFLFLPAIGMPGAMTIAGGLNLVVAAGAWLVSRGTPPPAVEPEPAAAPAAAGADADWDPSKLGTVMGVAAAITGATSFVYEIVWVRMLNQALGTTLHSFELMLAAFILGLAFGGLFVALRGPRIGDPLRWAGLAQVAMGVAALLSAPAFANSFHWVGWLTNALTHDAPGYTLYIFGSAAIALAVMFPAAFFAGMTLPLFTMALLRNGRGEASIGRIYAANTAGAILGVLLTVHVLVPAVGLTLSLVLAAALDLALGLFLLRFVARDATLALVGRCAVAGAAVLAVALLFGRPDPVRQVSGVFRSGKFFDPAAVTIRMLRDGKTSTVAFVRFDQHDAAAILTNGKSDATLPLSVDQAPMTDEYTMTLAAALPLATHPDPRRVAIVGWGSGLTTHTLLGSDRVEHVDNIEIEQAMHDAARLFGDRVARAYTDPRSRLIVDDARTYFATGGKTYDVIVSEPSNPWVTGVAGLFTDEFYGFVSRHLDDDGQLAQWIQTYELSDELLAKAVAAMLKSFPHAELYLTNEFDLVFLGSKSPLPAPQASRLDTPPLRAELGRLGLSTVEGLAMRRIGSADVLRTFVRLAGAEGNSDYHPVLALQAPKSRFMGDVATLLPTLVDHGLPLLDLLDGRAPVRCAHGLAPAPASRFQRAHDVACSLVAGFAAQPPTVDAFREKGAEVAAAIETTLRLSAAPVGTAELGPWTLGLAELARLTIGALPAADLRTTWIEPAWVADGQPPLVAAILRAYRAAAQRDAAALRGAAVEVLDAPDAHVTSSLREQMLLLAMMGAAAERDHAGVRAIEERYGPTVAPTQHMTVARMFLLAWSDR